MKPILIYTEEFGLFKKALNDYAMRKRLHSIERNKGAQGLHVVYFNDLSINEAFVLGTVIGLRK